MSRYKAYPAYRDSGIEWVGEIPKSWQVTPLFSVASTGVVKNDDGAESNVLSLSYGRIIQRDVEDNHGLLPESFNTYQIVDSASIILRLTDLQNDKRSLRVGMANERGIITSAYLKLTAKVRFLDRYLYRLLHSYDTTKVFYGMGGGLRQSMKFEEMRRLQMLCPSLDEQKQIAAFLDHETAKIDALIEKQQRLIELLKEKRQAVISHAVTKGLNPNAPMKDSGVEWLGEVPEHWDIKRISYVSQLRSGDAIVSDQIEAEGDYPVYGGNGLRGYCPNFNLDGNFILIGRQGALCGNINYGSGRFWASEHAIVVYPSLDLDVKWFGEALRAMNLNQYNVSAAQPGLAVANIVCLKIPFHPKKEQELIAAFLDHETAKIDTLIEKQQRLIELAQERRTALISAAVTGKIDVRDWQPAAAQAVVGVAC